MADDPSEQPEVPVSSTTTSESVEISVPPAMVEPAQALEGATHSGVAQSASAVATSAFHQNILVTHRKNGPGFSERRLAFRLLGPRNEDVEPCEF